MKKLIIACLALTLAPLSFADMHGGDADAVLELVKQHWQARNDNDYKAQVALMSSGTHYHANSNGTFFSKTDKPTVKQMEEDLADGEYDVEVYHPNAVALSDTVVLARYYLEGTITSGDTTVSNYRTRVTHIWVKENGAWKSKSWHFSPLHDGGTVLN